MLGSDDLAENAWEHGVCKELGIQYVAANADGRGAMISAIHGKMQDGGFVSIRPDHYTKAGGHVMCGPKRTCFADGLGVALVHMMLMDSGPEQLEELREELGGGYVDADMLTTTNAAAARGCEVRFLESQPSFQAVLQRDTGVFLLVIRCVRAPRCPQTGAAHGHVPCRFQDTAGQ